VHLVCSWVRAIEVRRMGSYRGFARTHLSMLLECQLGKLRTRENRRSSLASETAIGWLLVSGQLSVVSCQWSVVRGKSAVGTRAEAVKSQGMTALSS